MFASLGVLALVAGCSDSDVDGDRGAATSPDSPSTTSAASAEDPVRPSAACRQTADVTTPLDDTDDADSTGSSVRIEVTVDGTPRSAQVHLPPGSADRSEPAPVVLSFHGLDGSAAVQQATDGLDELADREGFVVVRPDGLEVGLNDRITGTTGWDVDGSRVDEAAFIAAVLDEVERDVCVDRAQVFATGFSAGGNIALVVACELEGRIAAVAPVGGAYQHSGCTEGAPLPLVAFHGTDDLIVPVNGRDDTAGTLIAVREVVEARAAQNGCAPEPRASEPAPSVELLRWSGCEATTELYLVSGNGHAWPGHPLPFDRELLSGLFAGGEGQPPNQLMEAIRLDPATMADNVLLTTTEIDATDLIWEFFADVADRRR